MTFDFRISFRRVFRSCGKAEVSTIVVVTFSGVPILGGIVICGRTDCILLVTKTSLTKEVMRLDFPVPSSPQTHIRTEASKLMPYYPGLKAEDLVPVAIADKVSAVRSLLLIHHHWDKRKAIKTRIMPCSGFLLE